jgi:hypothetical protein
MKSTSVKTTGAATAAPQAKWVSAAAVAALLCGLSACSNMPGPDAASPGASQPAAPVDKLASAEPVAAPASQAKAASSAESTLADGLKFYQGGQYRAAETQLKTALQLGLSAPADAANAHKHLAFIYCTSKRDKLCAAAFKAAKAADPAFALSKAEAGHPMWSRTYKKALGIK